MKAIVTVIGKDTKGIIAGISNVLCEKDINILDIKQQVMSDIFSMVMLVDITSYKEDLQVLRDAVETKAQELGVKSHLMHEDLFNSMHRI